MVLLLSTLVIRRLTVGDPVVLTFLRLVSVMPASSPPPRCCYAVSSEFTDIVIAPRINDLSAVDGVSPFQLLYMYCIL